VQDPGAVAERERRAVAGRVEPVPPRPRPDELDRRVVDEGREDAHGVRAAADARDDAAGSRPHASSIWARASSPMIRCRSRTSAGNGRGPTTEPMM
jgi:hypothetical protein